MFLVLEGIEGSGKSTQARLLGEWLARQGRPHLVTREPGGTAVGEAIREVVLHGGDVTPRTELLLMLAARATFVTEVVAPALAEGRIVVADRFELSTLAYQAHGRGLPLDEVRRLNAFATGGLAPDLTIVLDVPASVGDARRTQRGAADRIERAGAAFHDRVNEAYRLLAASEPGVVALPAEATVEAVHASIVTLLASRFPETFNAAAG
ncbi:MAG TPA: dTMP kinase [Longimicrobiales bacterium]|nr:dTMP kinase [Longimicrobiales bacterium]